MSTTPNLRSVFAAAGADTAPDAELLRRFADANDRTAFELVVRRHAELVWGVCRSALPRDPHAAEDAFQATFLILARKAGTIRDGSAAGWLFRVARNVAVRARARAARQEAQPLPDAVAAGGVSTEEEAARREVAPVVAEEVNRLAAALRDPVVLCFFEGHTHAEAAARLGWPVGTVASRLARAKELLRDRLTRRGVVLPAAGLAGVFTAPPAMASPSIPSALAVATDPAERVPPTVLSLAQGVLSAMRFTQLKSVAALVVVAVGFSVALAAMPGRQPQPPGAAPGPRTLVPIAARPDPAQPKEKTAKEPEAEELKKLQGKWRVVRSAAGGQEIPADQLAKTRVTIEKDKFIDDGASDRPLTMAIKFPAGAGKQAIDLVIAGGPAEIHGLTMPGLYKLEGDTLTLCIRDMEHLKKGRPTDFKPDETSGVMVLERIKDEKDELKALAGEWKGVKMIVTVEEVIADKTAKPNWVIDGPKVEFAGEGELAKKATIKLDPSAAPPTIDLAITDPAVAGKQQTLRGIYYRQGDKLTVAIRDPTSGNGDRPTELKPGDGVTFLVLTRVKTEKEELAVLAGEWTVTALNVAGVAQTADEIAKTNKTRWVFDGATGRVSGSHGAGQKVRVEVDPTSVPPTIDVTFLTDPEANQPDRWNCVYALNGDTLTLVVHTEKGERPKEVKPGKDIVLIVLERKPKK